MSRFRPMAMGFTWLFILASAVSAAPSVPSSIKDTYPEHTRAVETARAGRYDEALSVLDKLLRDFPDDYPLNRDYILVNIWKGDCDTALARFERVRERQQFEPYFVDAVANCAAARAQAGDPESALKVLEVLAARAPQDYRLQRDIIVIHSWNRQCRSAIERYDGLSSQPAPEPYFAIAVAECLRSQGRRKEAVALLEQALARAPDDEKLQRALARAKSAMPLESRDEDYRELVFDFATDESDQGLREYYSRLELSTRVATNTRVYARYLATRSDDEIYRNGDLDRAGVGVRYRLNEQWSSDMEIATDVDDRSRSGASARLFYQPRDTWRYELGYTSWAEDLPLRARAANIDATRWNAAAEYNSLDYVWYGRVSASRYDFSDRNRRESLYGTIGYAYEMLPYREQRVYLEAYESSNTITTAPYFNPKHDRSLGVVHRTDFVFDSRYQRHVDTLFLAVSAYDQQGFGTHGRWSVKYEQRYDFDDFNAFSWSARYGRFVYDGGPEYERRLELRYVRRF